MEHIEIHYLSSIEVEIRFIDSLNHDSNRRIFLLGTAHVSEQSARQTEEQIAKLQPDCICIELDSQRYQTLQQKERWQNLNLFKILKEGKGFLLLVNLLLASFQKRVGRDLAMKPGQEMIRAMELAHEKQIHLELVDRSVEVTLKRAWAKCNLWQRSKLLNSLLASLFSEEKISEEYIEKLKEADTLEHLMEEFANYLPSIKTSLIDERDVFLARSIAGAPGKNIFAVLGAGHLRGVCLVLEKVLSENGRVVSSHHRSEEDQQLEDNSFVNREISSPINGGIDGDINSSPNKNTSKNLPEWLKNPQVPVPQNEQLLYMSGKSFFGKILPWIIPMFAIVMMAAGFFFADTQKALQGLGIWVLSHSVLAGFAALCVLAHPISILVAILTSPFTALNPTISVGLVTALCEVLLRKPRVKDAENLLELGKWWQFRQNRIWHALIIFIVVSLGGAIATFIALPWLSVLFSV